MKKKFWEVRRGSIGEKPKRRTFKRESSNGEAQMVKLNLSENWEETRVVENLRELSFGNPFGGSLKV